MSKAIRSVLAAGFVLALVTPCLVHGEYVFLRDGTILRGRVYREGQLHRDQASGNVVWLADTQGFYLVADGARRIAFSQKNVHLALPDSLATQSVQSFRLPRQLHVFNISPTLNRVPDFTEVGPWIASDRPQVNGSRVLKGDFQPGLTQRVQYITSVTPEAIQAGVTEIRWTASYRPDEFDRSSLLSILRHHLASRKPPMSAWERGLSLFRYCLQTGWLEEAEAELANLRGQPEASTDTLVQLEEQLRQAQAEQLARRIEWANASGQYRAVEQLLSHFPAAYASEKSLRTVRTIQVQLQERRRDLEVTKRLLESVSKAAPETLPEAVREIAAHLNEDTCTRLDAFRRLALQEERWRHQEKIPQLSAEQLLALAVTGWLVGDRLAEARLETAQRLWQDRRMVQEILLQDHPRDRLALIEKLHNQHSQDLDLLVQLVRELPPPRAESTPPAQPRLQTTLGPERHRYLIQLPNEYHPYRRYPVLVILPDAGQDLHQAMEPWRQPALARGYILVAVPWAGPVQSSYRWTAPEQLPVLQVLRDLRRRYAVDVSRVFLFGLREGGSLAFDLGMSHPDHFAGVVVMSGRTGPHQATYWTNAQYLPFYVVDGELDGPKRDGNPPANEGPAYWRALFRNWLQAGFPSLYIEYDGRGREFFAGEIPDIFDWMSRKTRLATPPELGRPQALGQLGNRDFVGIRPEDDRFYWLSLPNAPGTHRLAARVAEGNRIQIATSNNVRRLQVWLNQDLVDFGQLVRVHLVSAQKVWEVRVQPDVRVLLEDYYQRGDRDQLSVGRLELEW